MESGTRRKANSWRLDIFQNCIVDFYERYLTGDPSRHANGQFENLRKFLAEETKKIDLQGERS